MNGLRFFLVGILVAAGGYSGGHAVAADSARGSAGGHRTAASEAPPSAQLQPAFIENALFSEGFDDITVLEDEGWFILNLSDPTGITNWFQGNTGVFVAHEGDQTNSYIGANFNNTASATGTISNWLMLPPTEFENGDELAFYTRTVLNSGFPDRLEVRLSLAGDSTDAGASASSTGDFTELLLTINENLAVGGYPQEWTRHSVILTGLPDGALGRLAFRYHVTSAGPGAINSDYIGIDSLSFLDYEPAATVATTVGTTPGACGTQAGIVVPRGSDVYICHALTNAGNAPLTEASFEGPFGFVGNLGTAPGEPDSVAVGVSVSWITGPHTFNTSQTLQTAWLADAPERGREPLGRTSSATVTVETRNLTVTAGELPPVAVAAGAGVELVDLTLAATGNSAVTVTALELSAADLAFSGGQAGAAGTGDVLEQIELRAGGATVPAAAAFAGTGITLTLENDLVIPAGGSAALSITAGTRPAFPATAGALAAAIAVAGAGLGLRSRPARLVALALLLAVALSSCQQPSGSARTATFTAQLTAVESDAEETTGLPVTGASVTVTY